jgi:hypothetical protein
LVEKGAFERCGNLDSLGVVLVRVKLKLDALGSIGVVERAKFVCVHSAFLDFRLCTAPARIVACLIGYVAGEVSVDNQVT